ncbi:MAG: hypothetical protein AAGA39_08695 [Pseudomonadota bacterium]
MTGLVHHMRANGLFYLLVLSYSYLVITMTSRLWFGDGVNIFATYTDAQTLNQVVLDANKVYWSKTSFLFLTLFFLALRLDHRLAAGMGATFWSSSLILMFGPSLTLMGAFTIGALLVVQQVSTRRIFARRDAS